MNIANGRYHLLLVDDNPVNLQLLEDLIAIHLPQCRTTSAPDGSSALALSLEHSFDGAFIDMQMPGMDGVEVCRRLKAQEKSAQLPVVLITAHQSSSELRARGLDAGAHDFISQPIRNVELIARIKVLLRMRAVADQLHNSNLGLRKQVQEKTSALRWLTGLMAASGVDGSTDGLSEILQLKELLKGDGKLDISGADGGVLGQFPEALKKVLATLALLKEFPVPLAEQLTGSEHIRGLLDYLERQNFFVSYCTESDSFRLSGPLLEYLTTLIKVELSAEEIRAVYHSAADWWLEHRQPVNAVDLWLQAGQCAEAEAVLREVSPGLYAAAGLGGLLCHEEQLGCLNPDEYPWLLTSLGIALLGTSPERGIPLLRGCSEAMQHGEDLDGVLFCNGHLLKSQLLFSTRCDYLQKLLKQTGELLLQRTKVCDPHITVQVGLMVAFGELMAGEGGQTAENYLEMVGRTSELKASAEYLAWYEIVRSYIAFQKGQWNSSMRILAQSWQQLHQQKVYPETLLGWALVRYSLYEVYSDFQALFSLQEQLKEMFTAEILGSSIFPLLFQFSEVRHDLNHGDWRSAQGRLKDLRPGGENLSEHYHGLSCELGALAAALSGDHSNTVRLAQDSILLQRQSGGRYFQGRNRFLMAMAFQSINEPESSWQQLEPLLTDENLLSDQVLLRFAHWLAINNRNNVVEPVAGLMVKELFDELSHQGLRRIPFWFPPVHVKLLQEALAAEADQKLLRKLVACHLNSSPDAAGGFLPFLDIRVLGGFSLARGNGEYLEKKDLSASFRHLFAMLVSSPDQQLGQDQVQAILWPESSPEKSRSKLDSLLLRLRKTLESLFDGIEAKRYVYLQKGVLCLEHCRIDAVDFERAARSGIRHARRTEVWQAAADFREAFSLWNGVPNLGIQLDEKSDYYRQDLLLLYLEAAQRWAEMLLQMRDYVAAVELSRQALKYDPTHDHLVRLQLQGCQASGRLTQTHQILEDYTAALKRDGHHPEEISEIVSALGV